MGVVTGEVACSGGRRVQTGEGSPRLWTEPGLLSETAIQSASGDWRAPHTAPGQQKIDAASDEDDNPRQNPVSCVMD